ncbi:aminotransferase class I/II-fold pyridoxal phosphate-dependent enzyme [Candidatus Bathyarchaeota archaeon]|nr:aminotransferase class I/II-fold pyridoxal phosphate-dependent enzyme [Candidatus Bathyarchaeota archaeon]
MSREKLAFLREEYLNLEAAGLNWKLRTLQGNSAPHCVVDGKKVIMLCSNNYLNLTNHPRLKEAAKRAIDTHGVGSGSVRPIAGNMDLHLELEKKLAAFKHAEGALVYSTGFAANAGLIPQLAGEGDFILSDELNHGSIIDGVRLSRAQRGIYKHCDVGDLERVLNEIRGKYRRILVISDGVFSMDGDIAPFDKIAKVASEFGAISYVDDAHGDGVLGEKGRGIASHFHIEGEIDVEMGTFSKAFGVVGGYVSGSEDLRRFAFNKSRTWLLSASHPPAVTAACTAALDVVENESVHLENLWKNTSYFKKELKRMGFDIGNSETPITPVIVGESTVAQQMSAMLYDEGVFALPIISPMVARDKARIRTMMNAGHTSADLDAALAAFEKIGRKLKIL